MWNPCHQQLRSSGPTPVRLWLALALCGLLALAACGGENQAAGSAPPNTAPGQEAPPKVQAAAPTPEPAPDPAKLARRGRSVYNQVCIACHASDPTQAGNIGPPIAGSKLALLETKVLRNQYPDGYAPQRDTLNMVPLPHLEKDLPALAAYLAEAAEGS